MARLPSRKKTAPASGRCVAVYNPSGTGSSMVIDIVCSASNKTTRQVSTAELIQGISLASDVDVFFATMSDAEQLSLLIQNVRSLTLLKLLPSEAFDDPTWNKRRAAIEETARQHSIPVHGATLNSSDPLSACIALANAANLST